MLDQELLREKFQQLLKQQRDVEGVYRSLAAGPNEPNVRAQLEQIHREKKRHIELTERLLEIVD